MGFQAEVLRVLIASPSDVSRQRDEIESAIIQWNKRYAVQKGIVLLAARWEDDIYPAHGKSDAQAIINEQLVEKCDILIGVFWNKLGTPTLRDKSGTLEEINIFIQNDKEVMLYFVDGDVPRNVDRDELEKVDKYKAEYGKMGVYAKYDHSKIVDHLLKYVDVYKTKQPISMGDNGSNLQLPQSQTVSNGSTNVVSIEQLMIKDRFMDTELLLFAYIMETGTRQFSTKSGNTVRDIINWESSKNIYTLLSNKYGKAIQNLMDRGIMEEFNTGVYNMSINILDEIRDLNYHLKEKIVNVVKSLQKD